MATKPSPAEPRAALPLAPLLAIVLLAFAVRLAHLYALSLTPFFTGLVVDARAYALDAETLMAQGAPDSGFYRPPLYPYIRAALALAGLGSPWALGIAHALAGAACAGLLYSITFRLAAAQGSELQHGSACAAGAIAALYGPLIVYDAEMLPPVWINLLIAIACAAATSQRSRLRAADFVSGASLGLATVGWAPSALLMAPILWLRRQSLARTYRWRGALAFLLALSLAPSLTALHNARAGEPGIVVSGNLGINLWLGNGPEWRRTAAARPGIYYDLEHSRPTRAGAVTLVERETFYLERVLEVLKSEPAAAFTRTAEKLYLFLHGREIRRDQDLTWLRSRSTIAALTIWEWGVFFPFGLLLPLALACPAAALRPRTKWVFVAGAALYAFALAWFIPGARYRLPIVLLLIPLASASVASSMAQLRRRSDAPRLSTTSAAVFLAALVLSNIPNAYASGLAATPTELLLLESQARAARNEIDDALQLARSATERSPNDPDAHIQLGQQLLAVGLATEAAYHFRRAGELVPASEGPWVLHGHAMTMLQREDDAIYNFREALKRNPYHREALRDLGTSYVFAGQASAAISAMRRYLDAGYRDDETSYKLAQLLIEENQIAEALAILLELRTRHPSSLELQRLLARTQKAQ